MHDARLLLELGDEAVRRLGRRGYALDLSGLEALSSRRAQAIGAVDELRADRGEGAAPVSISLRQVRGDLRGEYKLDSGFLEGIRLRVGVADYKHTEFEGEEVGTVFKSNGVEGRLELVQRDQKGWRGASGAQYFHRDFEAVGAEAFLPPNTTNNVHRALIIALAARHRLPSVYAFRFFVMDGGLMSYAIDQVDMFRQTASYVDRILRGANPVDIPVQAPTKFKTTINLKTAKALGLEVPPGLLVAADELIE